MEAPTSHPSSRLLRPRRVQKLQLAPGERLTVFSLRSVWIADVSCGTPPTRCASLVARHALRASPNAALLRDTRSSCGLLAWHGLPSRSSDTPCNVGSAATAERTMTCLANMVTKNCLATKTFVSAGNRSRKPQWKLPRQGLEPRGADCSYPCSRPRHSTHGFIDFDGDETVGKFHGCPIFPRIISAWAMGSQAWALHTSTGNTPGQQK